jgi:hypothetical protein
MAPERTEPCQDDARWWVGVIRTTDDLWQALAWRGSDHPRTRRGVACRELKCLVAIRRAGRAWFGVPGLRETSTSGMVRNAVGRPSPRVRRSRHGAAQRRPLRPEPPGVLRTCAGARASTVGMGFRQRGGGLRSGGERIGGAATAGALSSRASAWGLGDPRGPVSSWLP